MPLHDSADQPAEDLGPDETLRARVHQWALGRTTLFAGGSSGLRLVRDPRPQPGVKPKAVALVVHYRDGPFRPFGAGQLERSGELTLGEPTSSYVSSWAGAGGSCAFQVPYDQLGLPAHVIRAAGPRLRASPLYELVRDHLVRLAGLADAMAANPGAAELGTATTELVRALLVSAAGGPAPELHEQTLATRVLAYAGQHVTDPGLTPQRIAGAHNISVRQLYKACANAGVRLEQWLIERRLEAARAELAAPSGRRRSIAATARACGFADPSHFSRRFRAAYGMTPRDWQRWAG